MLYKNTEFFIVYEDGSKHVTNEITFWNAIDRKSIKYKKSFECADWARFTFINSSGEEVGIIYKWGRVDIKDDWLTAPQSH